MGDRKTTTKHTFFYSNYVIAILSISIFIIV